MSISSKIATALEQIDDWIGESGVPGAAAVIWHRGEIAGRRYAGEAKPDVPVDEQTLFGLASVTKPMTAATVMTLVENDEIDLDAPVATYLPEFATGSSSDDTLRHLRETITVRQVLSHTSGLPEDLPRGTFSSREAPTLREITDAMLRQPLWTEPGSELIYSNTGYGILGRLVETVSGRDFWDLTWENVFEPLELHDTIARPGPELDDRIARIRDVYGQGRPTESYNSQYWRDLAIPWGGLYGSPDDAVRFAATFLRHGDGFILPQLAAEMIADQVHGLPGEVQAARVKWPVASWGLGWEIKGQKAKHWTGNLTSPQTFCHFGAAGTLLWADPTIDLAAAIFANRATFHLWPFVPPRWATLSDALVNAVQ
ncbi:MAG: beta-lactamase family protein [Thermomicrobiales bacterium]|nr:beta-lactamase family protein [Thermomicrobiales bacterium]